MKKRSKKSKTKVVANIRVGEPDVKPSAPSHVRGVFQGNQPYPSQRHKGIDEKSALHGEGTARRSTGIRPDEHDVIDPRMPKISPA